MARHVVQGTSITSLLQLPILSSSYRVAMGRNFLGTNVEDLTTAADRIKSGRLVAFPTETVYGLGANALDRKAVLDIFAAKGRPLTDPLIVHVNDLDQACSLVQLQGHTKDVFLYLAGKFWPGPMTLVAKAADHLPSELSAGTGYVGVRCPNFRVARELIKISGVPIAAPSANTFGHVSPTTADHVFNDLGDKDVAIIDGGKCQVGIESTVMKIDEKANGNRIVIYRKGGVSQTALEDALEAKGWKGQISIVFPTKVSRENHVVEAAEAPGQELTHYAPDINTWMLDDKIVSSLHDFNVSRFQLAASDGLQEVVEFDTAVILDFGGQLSFLKDRVLAYRDLAKDGDVSKAVEGLYENLRWSESVEGAKNVVMVQVSEEKTTAGAEHVPAIADKMFRAASGKVSVTA